MLRLLKKLLIQQQRGFTLIELLVVFSTIGILATVGIASFVNYSRTQDLNQATFDVVTQLNFAKARARTQVKPKGNVCDPTGGVKLNLEGYEIYIKDTTTYELWARCEEQRELIESKSLSKNVQNPVPTFHANSIGKIFLFKVLSGSVTVYPSEVSNDTIIIKGYPDQGCKQVSVDANGRITISNITCPS